MTTFRLTACAVTVWVVMLAGCDKTSTQSSSSTLSSAASAASPTVAKVNGSAITQAQLERAIVTTLGEAQASLLDDNGRQKLLESMAMSRAMAAAGEKELSTDERATIDQDTAAYREQLLVKAYLQRHSTPTPVTDEMVKAYYEQHPERFGAKTVRQYEMLMSSEPVLGPQRDTMLTAVSSAAQNKSWRDFAKQLQQKGHAVTYATGNADPETLREQLRAVMKPLRVGDVSSATFIDGKLYVVRVTGDSQTPPKPLADVATEIRKALLPVQLKQAVKSAADELMKTVKVEYAPPGP